MARAARATTLGGWWSKWVRHAVSSVALLPVTLLGAGCAVDDRALQLSGDAGAADVSASDAPFRDGGAPATGPCVPGESCVPANPCHTGEVVCSPSGTSSCRDTQKVQANGTSCDDGSVCREGVCSPCAEGTSCPIASNPCRIGKLDCSSGAPSCVEADNRPNGTSCGGTMVCDEGRCTACADGRACIPANTCHSGTLDCTGAVPTCVDRGSNRTSGATCGPDSVCNDGGACVACKSGASCTIPGNACRQGTIACNTGGAVCVESGNTADGTGCDAGKICVGGACTDCIAGASCVPANRCHRGRSVCSPAIACIDTGEVVPSGTSCGAAQVCSGGACTSCAEGKPCESSSLCKAGAISCANGVATCTEKGDKPNGVPCGPNRVCSAGSCVPCQAGSTCTPANPCFGGTLSCDPAPTCTASAQQLTDGTRCGTDLVCRASQCVACKADVVCQPSNACKLGVGSCASGSFACVDTVNKAAGAPCGVGMVCNGAGACVTCKEGDACPPANPCHVGKLSCAGGVTCGDTGTAVANGTGCGKDLVCSGGVCASCTEGLACALPSICKMGRISCKTGAAVCTESGNKPVGTACGTGMVCSTAGTCVACNAGAPCKPEDPCHQGTYACNTGAAVCVDSGLPAADGTVCGADLFCRAGTCAACKAGEVCQPSASCKTGVTACTTGTSMCTASGNKPAGTVCGAASSCASGMKTAAPVCDSGGQCLPAVKTACPNGCNATATDCLTCSAGQTPCAGACCAAGQGCCGGRCVSLATATNCGSCGHDCTILRNLSSPSLVTCVNGGCRVPQAACSAGFGNCTAATTSDADGCETPTTTNANCGACGTPCAFANGNASCATGTCRLASCVSNAHQCGNACFPNDDATHCGAACVNCTQPNGPVVCLTAVCTCAARGPVLRCPGDATGKVVCGAWSFNNGAEGWTIADTPTGLYNAWDRRPLTSASYQGFRALVMGFNNTSTGEGDVLPTLHLCNNPIDLSAYQIDTYIWLEAARSGEVYLKLDNGAERVVAGCDMTLQPGVWNHFTCDLRPQQTAIPVTDIQFVLRRFVQGAGTMYMREVRLSN